MLVRRHAFNLEIQKARDAAAMQVGVTDKHRQTQLLPTHLLVGLYTPVELRFCNPGTSCGRPGHPIQGQAEHARTTVVGAVV